MMKNYLTLIFSVLGLWTMAQKYKMVLYKNGTTFYEVITSEIDSVKFNTDSSTTETYNIGDVGPAGGLIFYDKGYYDDGWQYLEAAPRDQAWPIWGCFGTEITGTQTTIGSGRANTDLIVAGCSESGFAAKLSKELSLGGKSDWFLPSKDELQLMYENLYQKGKGGFKDYDYWSSSEYGRDQAWRQHFYTGGVFSADKDLHSWIRAVRAF